MLIAEAEQGVVAFAGFCPAAGAQAVAEVGTFLVSERTSAPIMPQPEGLRATIATFMLLY
ncbi:hypothetical protein GCM10009780_68470 [Actinomadura alba]